jgi:F-type H+-transporting ATPase subunit b
MHIDWWTLAFQTVNVLVLIWILARFFFRPVADIVAKRQAQANKVLADAAAARQQAADARTGADKALAEINAERERLIAEAHKVAAAERASLLAQSSSEIAKQRLAAEAANARELSAAKQAIVARASELSVDIAQRLLERLPPNVALSTFLEGLCRELRALPLDARASFASTMSAAHPIEVVTAVPLSKDEMEHVRAALTAAFGLQLPLAFRTDPALLAGIELRSPNTILRNCWRADLDQIRKELDRDTPSGGS